jgi:hypothetical protein
MEPSLSDHLLHRLHDNYLNNYEELERTFPSMEDLLRSDKKLCQSVSEGKKPIHIQGSPFKSNLNLSREWRNLIDYHTSKEYFEKTFLSFPEIRKYRPKLFDMIESGVYYYGKDIQYEVLFIIDTKKLIDEGLSIHLDNNNKVFQSMIYFKNPQDTMSDVNVHLSKEDGTEDLQVDYIQNRCLIMPFTPHNWHYVTPGSPRIHRRKMIDVIFTISEELQEL